MPINILIFYKYSEYGKDTFTRQAHALMLDIFPYNRLYGSLGHIRQWLGQRKCR